jgi:hypothetical protein
MTTFLLVAATLSILLGLAFIAVLLAEQSTIIKLSNQFVNKTMATILMAIAIICFLLSLHISNTI